MEERQADDPTPAPFVPVCAIGASASGVGVLTKDFCRNLLDTDIVWEKAEAEGMGFVGRDRATGAGKHRAWRFDLVFGANARLRSTIDVYASRNGHMQLVRDFVRIWDRVTMLDWYDVKGRRRYAPMTA